ncbi:MAG TPA: FAD-dependent oxidoreductase, partial [Longimicrobiales bacterium]|nr:FAD-dependent oxidoreductase [Longimicrobiales bacterium]
MAGNGNGGNDFDLVIIGGGPGGYVAAIRAAQLGMSVACVEKEKLGGVCLNIGCIPTKALLSSALLANEMKDAEGHGIRAEGLSFDLGPAQERSRRVADQMNRGVHHLFKKYGATHVEGHGRIAGKGKVEVENDDGGTDTLRADHVIVATGSRPRNLPILEIDEEMIWSSTGALFQEAAPETLAVVGAGAVGMEFADVYEAYGSRVTILEALERVLPIEDEECSKAVARSFEKRGMEIHTSARLESSEAGDDSVKLVFTDAGGEEQTLEVERVLSAVGRVPNTEDVGLDAVGVERTEEGGFIAVDEWLRTNVDGVYAIGDCAGNQLLAHKASHEGLVCVEKIA